MLLDNTRKTALVARELARYTAALNKTGLLNKGQRAGIEGGYTFFCSHGSDEFCDTGVGLEVVDRSHFVWKHCSYHYSYSDQCLCVPQWLTPRQKVIWRIRCPTLSLFGNLNANTTSSSPVTTFCLPTITRPPGCTFALSLAFYWLCHCHEKRKAGLSE